MNHHPDFQNDITRHVRDMRRRVGVNIHAVRVRKGWRMEKLARLSGVPAAVIDQMELGKGNLDFRCLAQLCFVLRVDVATLLK